MVVIFVPSFCFSSDSPARTFHEGGRRPLDDRHVVEDELHLHVHVHPRLRLEHDVGAAPRAARAEPEPVDAVLGEADLGAATRAIPQPLEIHFPSVVGGKNNRFQASAADARHAAEPSKAPWQSFLMARVYAFWRLIFRSSPINNLT